MTQEEIHKVNPKVIVWDFLDEAIMGIANKELDGPIVVTLSEDPETLVLEFFDNEEETYDNWGRREFGPVVAYDINKIIDILMRDVSVNENDLEDGMTVEDAKYETALEYFEFNIDGAWVGEFTPIHILVKEEE